MPDLKVVGGHSWSILVIHRSACRSWICVLQSTYLDQGSCSDVRSIGHGLGCAKAEFSRVLGRWSQVVHHGPQQRSMSHSTYTRWPYWWHLQLLKFCEIWSSQHTRCYNVISYTSQRSTLGNNHKKILKNTTILRFFSSFIFSQNPNLIL